MGLPEINISFTALGSSAITRSARGMVACILHDDTVTDPPAYTVYGSIADVDFTQFSAANYTALKMIFGGTPSKVIVVRVASDATDYAPALKTLGTLQWSYLTAPSIPTAQIAVVVAWIKEQRDQRDRTYKAVLANTASDHEGIINLTTGGIQSSYADGTLTAAAYCPRIAGLLAGLPLSRSSTYCSLEDITVADTPSDPDDRIDAGELVIVYSGSRYVIGRGVNSLTTHTASKSAAMSKIKIVEGVDLYKDDIRQTFATQYVGRVVNDYDAKQALVAAIMSYHRELSGDVLDAAYDNTVAIDLEAQRAYLEAQGINTTDMDDTLIAQANTGSRVYLRSSIRMVDAMEDLTMVCSL